MENASKALIIVASTLIGIILFSFMLYMFKRFGATARATDTRISAREADAFNSKFSNYDTGAHSDSDTFSVITYGKNPTEVSSAMQIKYFDLFKENTTLKTPPEKYQKYLVSASQSLLTCYDVVTAVNDAIDINRKNNNNYRYNAVEVQNSVEIIIDLNGYQSGSDRLEFANGYKYLLIEPNKGVKAKHVYGSNSISSSADTNTQNKENNVNLDIFKDAHEISVYDLLETMRNTEIIMLDNKAYTVYQYYFFGEIFINGETGLIETIKFKAIKDKNFENRT